ncbi:hypothetical protein FA287_04970 [Pseudomonas aeruginosa]|nr:hypothetical protein [Pseudomonas aeruginosa]
MSKGLNAKKETRRKPLKTAQEKRLAKRAKKHAPAAPLGTPPRAGAEPQAQPLNRPRRGPGRGTAPR